MDGQPANPYAAPRADTQADVEAEEAAGLESAGLGLRFANYFIDSFVGGIIQGAISLAALRASPSEDAAGILLVVGFAAMFSYFVVFEGVWGRTIGKLITGTRVVRFDGYKPHLPQTIGRTFARCIPFEQFSFLFSSNALGWHDTLSGTRVVRVRR
jgi:uncharacterized RDD family membrane protein YckC